LSLGKKLVWATELVSGKGGTPTLKIMTIITKRPPVSDALGV
jgi:hypothetical protein